MWQLVKQSQGLMKVCLTQIFKLYFIKDILLYFIIYFNFYHTSAKTKENLKLAKVPEIWLCLCSYFQPTLAFSQNSPQVGKVRSCSWHFNVLPLEGALKFTAREIGLENRGHLLPSQKKHLLALWLHNLYFWLYITKGKWTKTYTV